MTRHRVLLEDHGYPLIWQQEPEPRRMAHCHCPVCRADRIVHRLGWFVIAATVLYYGSAVLGIGR